MSQAPLDPTPECFSPSALGAGGAPSFDGGCPSAEQVNAERGFPDGGYCGQIVSAPTSQSGQCCYQVQECGSGRPYLEGGRARTSLARRAAGDPGAWRSGALSTRDPLTGDLTLALRALLAAAWTADGLLEHASIASFGRFAFELMAVGAPADLVAEAHRAAADEVEHARLCLGLAGAYAGETVVPSPFPFSGRVEVSADLASIAVRAVHEGCIGETLASIQAAEQLARAEDPAVRDVLAVIVEDEARHAELSWRFVAWALAHGGAEVHAAVAGAFAGRVAPPPPSASSEALAPEMAAHGRLDPVTLRAVHARALTSVVQPCAARLLAAASAAMAGDVAAGATTASTPTP